MKFVRCLVFAASAAVGLGSGGAFAQDVPLKIVYTTHATVSNSFWRGIKRGFDQACLDYGADCRMVFATNADGAIAEQVSNMHAVIAQSPDAIIVPIANDDAICPVVREAIDRNIIVIASNVDALSKQECGRLSYLGQNFIEAGQILAMEVTKLFPAEGPIHVLLGISRPGGNWAEDRAKGIEIGLEAYKQANPDRQVEVVRIDSGVDLAIVAERVMAYMDANPDVTAYLDMGFWQAAVARVLEDRGVPPGQFILAGFDIIPEVVDYMEKGYIQPVINQGPYLQGYLPVVQVHLMKRHLQPAWSVDTGRGIYDIEGAKKALESFK